jgi:hypothetical protein
MSDTHQAIYDAVRSRLHNCDVGQAIRDACQLDAIYAIQSVQQEMLNVAYAMQTPSAIYRPRIAIDGNQWGALYGDNLQEGVAGFGDSPAAAMADFDKNWNAKLPEGRNAD